MSSAAKLIVKAAGAGSRGGHVIGSTKAGHPIYQSRHAKYAAMHVQAAGSIKQDAEHLDGKFGMYTAQDHEDAASAHFKQAYKADVGQKQRTVEGADHMRAALAHNRVALNMRAIKSETPYDHPTQTHKAVGDRMKSTATYTHFLAKAQVKSGGIDNAETVDADADMTGVGVEGRPQSSPSDWAEQEAEDRKVSRKYKGVNSGKKTSELDAKTGANSISIDEKKLGDNHGPYDCDGDEVDNDIGSAAPTKTIDGGVYRSMGSCDILGDFLKKAGEGSRGRHMAGHTKSGQPVYQSSGRATSPESRAKNLSSLANGHKPQTEGQNRAAMRAHEKASDAHYALCTDDGDRAGKAHSDAAQYYEDRKGQYEKSLLCGDLNKSAEHSLGADMFKAANGKDYAMQRHDLGYVQHTTGGMDSYCAELAKGGTFWSNGMDALSGVDAGMAAQTLCKGCGTARSILASECANCAPNACIEKSLGQVNLSGRITNVVRDPGSVILGLDDLAKSLV